MRVYSIVVRNYGPFEVLEEVRLGPLATIVGQNDAGKSSILRALQLFLEEKPKIEDSDVHQGASSRDDVVIEVAFTALPENINLEEDVETTLQEEMLLDSSGHLNIRKTFPRSDLSKFSPTLITYDFENDAFAEMTALKENELNKRCESVDIEVTKAGRGITNKSKRQALRAKAREQGITLVKRELPLATKTDLWKKIASLLPELIFFETDTRLGVGETSFQSQFRPIIRTAAENREVVDAKNKFTGAIGRSLQDEMNKIYERLCRHTDAFVDLEAKPEFSWDKAVTFQVFGKDQQGVENSLDRRGSGMRRLLMVAFFQYLAERGKESGGDFLFAVEEPENCLHPGLQRELVSSFRQLADEGYQVIVSSHSPVFAGASPIEDLALVIRKSGVAKVVQVPDLDLSLVAEELGVEPSDQITGYNACIFVEGWKDADFWETVATKLKGAGHLEADFNDSQMGFVSFGGVDSLKYWIDMRSMTRLNRRFGVVVDSDRKSNDHSVAGRKLQWKEKCEEQDGIFFILRKREVENYLHPKAIQKLGLEVKPYDDFTDMKKRFGENVFKAIKNMSAEEILEMDRYEEDGTERHELVEILRLFIALPQTGGPSS